MPLTAPPAPSEPALAETGFAAMGSQVHILALDAPAHALPNARAAVGALERRWSRFRPDSDVSRINAADGQPVTVSTTTATLIALAVRGWAATGGAHDPTVLDAVIGAGYDRSFELIATHDAGPNAAARPAPGCGGIAVDVDTGLVRLPASVHIDPGGIARDWPPTWSPPGSSPTARGVRWSTSVGTCASPVQHPRAAGASTSTCPPSPTPDSCCGRAVSRPRARTVAGGFVTVSGHTT